MHFGQTTSQIFYKKHPEKCNFCINSKLDFAIPKKFGDVTFENELLILGQDEHSHNLILMKDS